MRFIATLLACLCLAGASQAQTLVKPGEVDQIVDIARGFGSGTLEKDETEYVRGRINGTLYVIFFNDCNSDRSECQSLQFYASWEGVPVDQAAINGWNRDKRFAKAYIESPFFYLSLKLGNSFVIIQNPERSNEIFLRFKNQEVA